MALNVEAFDAPALWPPAVLPSGLVAPQSVVTARYSDRGYLSRAADAPAHTLYEARLLGDVDVGQSVADFASIGGRVALTVGELEFWNGDDVFNAIAAFGAMDGRAARIRTAAVANRAASDWGTPLSSAVDVWRGRATRVEALGMRARMALSDITDRFGTLLQSQLYDGAGGVGGAPELKGLPKPVSLGNRFNVTPVYIGLVDLGFGALPTYQTHHRTIVAHDVVRIRGVPQQLVGMTPTLGQYVDVAALGLFQLGSTADGPVTCDVRGDAPGGRYAKSVPDCVRVLLQALGPGLVDDDFDVWSWFKIGPQLTAEIGWGMGATPIATEDALGQILASCGAWLSGSRLGQLKIALLNAPAAVADLTLTHGDILDLKAEPIAAALQPTPQVVEILSGRNWTPLDDIAGVVTDPERAALISPGGYERAFSNAIAARSTSARSLRLEGLYRYAADAQARAAELRTWLERGLRMITVATDRYLGQVELGMTAHVTYPYFGLSSGWSGLVVGWRERVGARRLELTLIG